MSGISVTSIAMGVVAGYVIEYTMRVFVALVLGASACLAQTITPVLPVFFPLQVKEYLALSPDQISKILGLNSALGAFRLEKTPGTS